MDEKIRQRSAADGIVKEIVGRAGSNQSEAKRSAGGWPPSGKVAMAKENIKVGAYDRPEVDEAAITRLLNMEAEELLAPFKGDAMGGNASANTCHRCGSPMFLSGGFYVCSKCPRDGQASVGCAG